jgi:hypothetical protein
MPRRTTGWSSAMSTRIRGQALGRRRAPADLGCEREALLQGETGEGRKGVRDFMSNTCCGMSYYANSLAVGE